MSQENISIRNLQKEDIPAAMKLVLAEGWNQTQKDWKLFIGNPKNICKCAEFDGKLVGTTTSYIYSNEIAWISMVLVNKEFRGKGISKLLLNSVLYELNNCKSIKLDATQAGKPIYEKFGFVEEYSISRLVNTSVNQTINESFDTLPKKIYIGDAPKIIDFDKQVFGSARNELLRFWIVDSPENCWLIKREGQISGFMLGRQGNRFFQIGPVSAKNLADAKVLILQTLENLKGKSVVIDVMDDKQELVDWLKKFGFEKVREFTRMFKKTNQHSGKSDCQFLIGGPEFG